MTSGAWVFRGPRIPVAALFDQGTPVSRCAGLLDGHAVATACELAQDWPGYGCRSRHAITASDRRRPTEDS